MEQQHDELNNLISLIRYAVCEYQLTDDEIKSLGESDYKKLFDLAKLHEVHQIVAYALIKLDLVNDNEIKEQLVYTQYDALTYYEQLNYELDSISSAFSENAIHHIPLKGAVIRTMYPEAWMRSSCDIDVFIHEKDLKSAKKILCDDLNYKIAEKTDHDVAYTAPNGQHLELHYSFYESNFEKSGVLDRIWDYTLDDGNYKYSLDNDFFVFYIINHSAKHFYNGGCGIRAILDLWIIKNRMQYNESKVTEMCDVAGYGKFYSALSKLSHVWFDGANHDELTKVLEKFIINGGIFGNADTMFSVRNTDVGKSKYLIKKLFPPSSEILVSFPNCKTALKRFPFILPFLWIARLVRLAFVKERRENSLKEYKYISESETTDEIKYLLDELEIKRN